MKPGAEFETKRVSEAIHCQASKPKMTHKDICTADLHLGTSAETWGTSSESRGRNRSGVTVKLSDHNFLSNSEKLLITDFSRCPRVLSSITDYFNDCFAIVVNLLKLGL